MALATNGQVGISLSGGIRLGTSLVAVRELRLAEDLSARMCLTTLSTRGPVTSVRFEPDFLLPRERTLDVRLDFLRSFSHGRTLRAISSRMHFESCSIASSLLTNMPISV